MVKTETHMKNNMEVSLVIPCLHEEDNIKILAQKIKKAFSRKFRYEIIWVDDGSTDRTAEEIKRLCKWDKRHKAIILMRRTGQSTALMAGFDHAQGKYIATMDGDNQNDPDEIPAMLEKLKKEELDMVVGWRKNRWKNNMLRRIPSLIANKLIARAFRTINIHDAGCPVKIARAEIIKRIRLYGELHRFLTYIAGDMGARVGEVEIKHRKRRNGQSKYGIGRTLKVIIDIVNLKFITMKKTTPIQMMGPIALGLFWLSGMSCLALVLEKIINGQDMTDSALLVLTVLLVVMGVQIFVMGLLGELIVRAYGEGGDRDSYFVREIIE